MVGSCDLKNPDSDNLYTAPNLDQRTDHVLAVPRPQAKSIIPPTMVSSWHKCGELARVSSSTAYCFTTMRKRSKTSQI